MTPDHTEIMEQMMRECLRTFAPDYVPPPSRGGRGLKALERRVENLEFQLAELRALMPRPA